MNSERLATYLSLERNMLALDAAGDPLADHLRDTMDAVWYSLTDEEHTALDARVVVDVLDRGIALPMTDTLCIEPPKLERHAPRSESIVISDWRVAA